MGNIIIGTGDQQYKYYPLGKRTTVIGRDESLPIQILDDMVSRRHVQVRFDPSDEQYHVTDMNSRNGVYVNGNQLSGEIILKDGDEIAIGSTKLLFTTKQIEGAEDARQAYKKRGQRDRHTVED